MALPLRSMLKRGDDVGLGAEADRGAERLAREHVRAVELAGDDAIEDDLPVGLRLERHVQAFVFEVAFLIGDGERRHVGELDEAELQLFFLELQAAACASPGAASARVRAAVRRRGFCDLKERFDETLRDMVFSGPREQKKTAGSSCMRGVRMQGSRRLCPEGPLLGPDSSVGGCNGRAIDARAARHSNRAKDLVALH